MEERNIRKSYEKPFAEKIKFDYRNQVIASGGNHFCYGSRGNNYTACRDNIVWND